MRDLYETLGVPRDADSAALKRAWRDKARKLHPDRNPDRPEAGKLLSEVSAAYDVLSDPERRALYDRYGQDAASVFFDPSTVAPPPTSDEPRGIRTGPVRAKPVEHGADANVFLLLTALQARRGGVHRVDIEPDRICEGCGGTGLRRSGRICSKCERGVIKGLGAYRVQVPAGLVSGQVLLAPGKGHRGTGRGARPGDLRITLDIEPVFTNEGLDRVTVVHVDPHLLSDGGVVSVQPPLGDALSVRLRPATKVGQRIRMRGKAEGGRDLIAELAVLPSEPVLVDVVPA